MPTIDEILQRLPGREGWKTIDEASAEIKPVTNSITQKTTNEPTGRYFVTIAGPSGATQRLIVRPDDQGGPGAWAFEGLEAVHALPSTSTSRGAVSGSQYGTWEPDPANPGGPYILKVPPQAGTSNPDEDRSKAIKAQTDEADRDRKIQNDRLYGLYAD